MPLTSHNDILSSYQIDNYFKHRVGTGLSPDSDTLFLKLSV